MGMVRLMRRSDWGVGDRSRMDRGIHKVYMCMDVYGRVGVHSSVQCGFVHWLCRIEF